MAGIRKYPFKDEESPILTERMWIEWVDKMSKRLGNRYLRKEFRNFLWGKDK